MSEFFVLTHRVVVGPLNGIELREAALAGIIHHTCVVGGSPDGPWHHGAEIGLFSQKGVPKPHPPAIEIPQFFIKGNRNSVQGPFKLRELVGMAARGMLPADAMLQRVGTDRWAKAERLPILNHCLSGDLVLVSASGEICQQTSGVLDGVNPITGRTEAFYAPIDRPQTIKVTDFDGETSSSVTAVSEGESSGEGDAVPLERTDSEQDDLRQRDQSVERQSRDSESLAKSSLIQRAGTVVRCRIPQALFWVFNPPKWAIQCTVALAMILLVLGSVIWWLRPSPVQQTDIIGDWVITSADNASPNFGISFDPDGTCVMFNVQGSSWTGDFLWSHRSSTQDGISKLDGTRIEMDTVGQGHRLDAVEPTDGYLMLRGPVQTTPSISGHEIQDLFLRRVGSQLEIGYPVSVEWQSGQKILSAGWVQMQPAKIGAAVDASELISRVSRDDPKPVNSRQRRLYQRINGESPRSGLVASEVVDSAFLLQNLGVPDLARKAFPVEIPDSARSDLFTADQIVRYGGLTFLVNSFGQIEHLQVASHSSTGTLAGAP